MFCLKDMVDGIVSFKDWEKLDLRVGEVVEVEDIEGADKLYKLSINIGVESLKIVCAGLKEYYSKEDLKGKKIILFVNLAPRKIRGIESHGMILAAVSEDKLKVRLLQPDDEIEIGSKVS